MQPDIVPIICHRCQQHKGNRWQNLPPVSLIPVANLPPVSLTPVVHLDLRISPRIFEKIRNDPNVIIRGLGGGDSWKKPEAKISWHCPFKVNAGIILFSTDEQLRVMGECSALHMDGTFKTCPRPFTQVPTADVKINQTFQSVKHILQTLARVP
jgi:hypothetical protein